jgi:hypothetical protein
MQTVFLYFNRSVGNFPLLFKNSWIKFQQTWNFSPLIPPEEEICPLKTEGKERKKAEGCVFEAALGYILDIKS